MLCLERMEEGWQLENMFGETPSSNFPGGGSRIDVDLVLKS